MFGYNNAIFEPSVLNVSIGDTVQMIRKGYYTLDKDKKSWNKTTGLKEGGLLKKLI